MATFLLTWNPNRWTWNILASVTEGVRNGRKEFDRWSTGVQKGIAPGDHLFLIRLGQVPRGIMGAAVAVSEVYEDEHWNMEKENKPALYVDLEWDALLNPEIDELLTIEELQNGSLDAIHWTPQGSGVRVPAHLVVDLESKWQSHLAHIGYWKEEHLNGDGFAHSTELGIPSEEAIAIREGNEMLRTHLGRERNDALRDRKLLQSLKNSDALRCEACNMSFSEDYVKIGDNFIEVHHKNPISNGNRISNLNDLALLCSNCHRMIHKTDLLSDIEGFKNKYIRSHSK